MICAQRSSQANWRGGASWLPRSSSREQYNASRNTVRDAIKWLTTLGLVETRPGQGTFVVEKINPFVTTLTGDPQTGRGGGEGGVHIAEVERSHRVSKITESSGGNPEC